MTSEKKLQTIEEYIKTYPDKEQSIIKIYNECQFSQDTNKENISEIKDKFIIENEHTCLILNKNECEVTNSFYFVNAIYTTPAYRNKGSAKNLLENLGNIYLFFYTKEEFLVKLLNNLNAEEWSFHTTSAGVSRYIYNTSGEYLMIRPDQVDCRAH